MSKSENQMPDEAREFIAQNGKELGLNPDNLKVQVIAKDPANPPELKPGETLYEPKKTPAYEISDSEKKFYLELILKNAGHKTEDEQGDEIPAILKPQEIAILRKLLLEHKDPVVINQEIIQEFGPKAGFHPWKFEEALNPVREKIYNQYGYEFPSHLTVNANKKLEGVKKNPNAHIPRMTQEEMYRQDHSSKFKPHGRIRRWLRNTFGS